MLLSPRRGFFEDQPALPDVFFSTSAMSNSTSVGLKNSTSRMSNCVQRPEKFDIGDVEFDIGDLKFCTQKIIDVDLQSNRLNFVLKNRI